MVIECWQIIKKIIYWKQSFIIFFFTETDIDTILTHFKSENIVQKKAKENLWALLFLFCPVLKY
jgi:hypothetical protein